MIQMRYKFTIEYDGTDFHGWQRQPDVRSVEEEVESALTKLYQQPIDVTGQGRTDTGVHARAQIAHADLPDRYSADRIRYALKGLLPADIVVHTVENCPDNFHARFDAAARSYSYHICTKPSAIYRKYQWYCFLNPEPDVLKVCSDKIRGTRNFINFCIPAENEKQTTLCTVSESRWVCSDNGESLIYRITANRFLRHMVRRLVGSMIQTAAGKMSMDQFDALLQEKEKVQKAYTAPANGLFLESVHYTAGDKA